MKKLEVVFKIPFVEEGVELTAICERVEMAALFLGSVSLQKRNVFLTMKKFLFKYSKRTYIRSDYRVNSLM